MRPDARFDLLFFDECEIHLHPTLTKTWTLRGTRPVVPAAGNNRKVCLYGALNYRNGQVHYMIHPKKNAVQFHAFLRQLLDTNRKRFFILVLDNASYHVTQPILDLLAAHADHILVFWLPTYSPNLNAIEGLWGYLKRSALNNYFFGTVVNLEHAIHQAFHHLNRHPNTTLSLAYKTSKHLGHVA